MAKKSIENKNITLVQAILVAGLLVAIITGIYVYSNRDLSGTGTSVIAPSAVVAANSASADNIAISNTAYTVKAGGLKEVVGEVTNNDTVARTMFLKATFYDASGGILGTANGAVDGLAPSQKKTFELITSDQVAGYKNFKVQVDSIY